MDPSERSDAHRIWPLARGADDMDARAGWRSGLPVLTGSRVRLREPVVADAAALRAVLGNMKVREHLPEPPPAIEPFHEIIRRAAEWRIDGRGWAYGIELHEKPGLIGLLQFLSSRDAAKVVPMTEPWEWGFALASGYWGRGLFREAGALALRFAFETVRLSSVEAWVIADNQRADRALSRLGGRRIDRTDTTAPDGRHGHFIVWTNTPDEQRPPAA
jgi:RimJ/RimL family protein N-acetyltransferase